MKEKLLNKILPATCIAFIVLISVLISLAYYEVCTFSDNTKNQVLLECPESIGVAQFKYVDCDDSKSDFWLIKNCKETWRCLKKTELGLK
jgi:type IV secretory pathway VirB6-like protein